MAVVELPLPLSTMKLGGTVTVSVPVPPAETEVLEAATVATIG
jgi:hypothetical protein